MADDYSVNQVARIIGKSDNTIRSWTKILIDELSEGIADRPKGTERRYTDEDVRIFQTARIMRDQRKGFDQILNVIRRGERLEPSEDDNKQPPPATTAADNKAALQVQVQMQGDMIQAANERINQLEMELKEEREARISAEQEATKSQAERRVDMLEAEIRFWSQPWHKRLWGRSSSAIAPAQEPKEDDQHHD